ncbi:MAG: 16S rRNA (adenine(1518)-N(6)/adenine(1519)-N(6))-dimethyltransferase RsmA [Thermomicrobiales bacterium]
MSDLEHTASLLPTTRRGWLALLARLDVRPSKGRGQNFLFERGVVSRIASIASVGAEDVVVEVGPGLGILTEELLRRAGTVIAIELDGRLAGHLRETFGHLRAFQLIEGDALRLGVAEIVPLGRDYHVVANLPYSIAAAVIRHFLEQEQPPTRITVMVQQEVAERIVATPPEMSILSVAAQFYASARIAFLVPPSVFIPPPKVHSAVVILDTLSTPRLPLSDHAAFFRLVNAGFRHKRKQMVNSIAFEIDQPKEDVSAWLASTEVDPTRRAQTLSVDEWVSLAKSAPMAWLS